MKIFIFYLNGTKDEINTDNYPGIDGLEILKRNNFCHVLYAWTHNKNIRKIFKQQRNMDIFRETIHEIPEDEFDKFSDEYSSTFLENRAITTKTVDTSKIICKSTTHILTTSQELDYIVENQQLILQKRLNGFTLPKIYFREEYFSEKYRKLLKFLNFDDFMSYLFPIEDNDIPFNTLEEDKLAIYSYLYHNTYRKELNNL